MGRLIDADDFIASLNEYVKKPMTAGLCATLVEMFPTAFDTEKVVEQLEDRKSQLLKEFVLKDKAQTVKENAISRMNEIDGCIEIVKRGGIDG